MQPDSGKSISLPDIQIYAVGLMVWHLLLNSTSSWNHMKRTFFFSSVAESREGKTCSGGFLVVDRSAEACPEYADG